MKNSNNISITTSTINSCGGSTISTIFGGNSRRNIHDRVCDIIDF